MYVGRIIRQADRIGRMVTLIAPSATRSALADVLKQSLDFHEAESDALSHDFHAFPAKFPPQLPRAFIEALTAPGDVVLDPMMGSGTTLVEALAAGRGAVGFDIDPLAVLLSHTKTTALDPDKARASGEAVLSAAELRHQRDLAHLQSLLTKRFDARTQAFLNDWFAPATQLELLALLTEIERVQPAPVRAFLKLAFSAIIITKSGGVSLAWDLAHTRPHKLKQGVAKGYKPAFKEFRKRLNKNISALHHLKRGPVLAQFGNAECLPLPANSVDLLFTSPPYAANAIDYMRAHKFSLAWLGWPIDDLATLRSHYIGGENTQRFDFEPLPPATSAIVKHIGQLDAKKGAALHRYYSEMARVLRQAYRVLRPGKVAVLVVGSSVMRGVDAQTHHCLADIGAHMGLEWAGTATRRIDRNRRLMPARANGERQSPIEQRMHEEYVVTFIKPETAPV